MKTVCFIVALFSVVSCGQGARTETVQEGYKPKEAIQFPHKLHAGKLKIDCAFCHKREGGNELVSLTNSCITCHVFPEKLTAKTPSKKLLRSMENCILEKQEVPEYLDFKIPDHGGLFRSEPTDSSKTLSIDMANCAKCHYADTEPFQYWRKPFQLDTLVKIIKQQK